MTCTLLMSDDITAMAVCVLQRHKFVAISMTSLVVNAMQTCKGHCHIDQHSVSLELDLLQQSETRLFWGC